MKRLVILAAVILTASCATVRQSRIVESYFLDYRPYTEAGFYLSPNMYPGEFDAIGDLLIKVTPAELPKNQATGAKFADGAYGSGGTVTEKLYGSDLLELIYKQASDLGADGISNLRLRIEYYPGTDVVNYYEVTGLAIKRK